MKRFAWRDCGTGRWATDYPPRTFSERASDARLFRHPGIFEYSMHVAADDSVPPAWEDVHLHLWWVGGR